MKTIDKILFGFGILVFVVGIIVFIKLSYTFITAPNLNLSDLTPYSILLSALIAAVAMYLSTRVNIIINRNTREEDAKNKQFEFMMNLYNFYYAHEGIRSVRFAIEYDNFKNESAKRGSDNEKYLFALLRYFENVCLMYHNKILSTQEIEPILYDMKKVYYNTEVQLFLEDIVTRYEDFNITPPYRNYLRFAKENF